MDLWGIFVWGALSCSLDIMLYRGVWRTREDLAILGTFSWEVFRSFWILEKRKDNRCNKLGMSM